MPERGALRVGLRCRLDLAEENESPLAAVERRLAIPCRPRCARELPRVEIDRRVRVDRVEMQMMESRRGEHGHLAHVGSDHYSSIRTTARGSCIRIRVRCLSRSETQARKPLPRKSGLTIA